MNQHDLKKLMGIMESLPGLETEDDLKTLDIDYHTARFISGGGAPIHPPEEMPCPLESLLMIEMVLKTRLSSVSAARFIGIADSTLRNRAHVIPPGSDKKYGIVDCINHMNFGDDEPLAAMANRYRDEVHDHVLSLAMIEAKDDRIKELEAEIKAKPKRNSKRKPTKRKG